MSTLKVNTILSETPNVTITDGLNVTGVSTVTTLNTTNLVNATPLSNRNKIINGAMTISQRGTSFASANNAFTLDRFKVNGSHDGAVTISQSSTSPDGFANSYKVDVTTADTSIAAAQYIQIYQRIEAQNLQDLAFGTSAAKTITVSFYVRSNLTGTYTFAMQQPDSSYRQMSQTYTIDSANTWERKTFTVVGDTSGGINNDNGEGLNLFWNLAIGSNFTTGSSSSSFITYAQTNFAAGHTANILSSTSNEFYLTGVQLEVGSVATPFEHRSYADEYRRCQRYYQKSITGENIYAGNMMGVVGGNNMCICVQRLSPPMRDKPSVSNIGSVRGWDGSNSMTITSWSTNRSTTDHLWIEPTASGTSWTVGRSILIGSNNDTTAAVIFDAEL